MSRGARAKSSRRASRRGFTLLEAILASLIGSFVLLAVLAMTSAMQRSQMSLSTRTQETIELQRLRLVVQRSMSGLLMVPSEELRQRPDGGTTRAVPVGTEGGTEAGTGGRTEGGRGGESRGDAQGEASSRGGVALRWEQEGASGEERGRGGVRMRVRVNGEGRTESGAGAGVGASGGRSDEGLSPSEARPDLPPRVLLEFDPSFGGEVMRARVAGGEEVSQRPQRLELVLVDAPVPGEAVDPFTLAREAKRSPLSQEQRDQAQARERRGRLSELEREEEEAAPTAQPVPTTPAPAAQNDSGVRAVRGALEVRRQPAPEGLSEAQLAELPPLYEVWWVPSAPRRMAGRLAGRLSEEGDAAGIAELASERLAEAVDRATTGDAVRVASNLRYVRWRFFDDRVRKEEFRAIASMELPAYVELDVVTRSGLRAQWLFEVSFAFGPEVAPPARVGAEARDASGSTARPTQGPGGVIPATGLVPAQEGGGIPRGTPAGREGRRDDRRKEPRR